VGVLAGVLLATAAWGRGDGEIHRPPRTGPLGYNTFRPGQPGFPARGHAYRDPVFGTEIRRITDEFPRPSGSQLYSKNGFWNADGSRLLHFQPRGPRVLDSRTGRVVADRLPREVKADASFAPDDPDTLYFVQGSSLWRYSLERESTRRMKDFNARLGGLGASVDWIDRSGRYMLLNLGGRLRVWDRRDDVLYAGEVPVQHQHACGEGWAGLSPDGRYLVTNAVEMLQPRCGRYETRHLSYAIDHAARTVDTTPKMIWSLCGDHADLVSATNGRTYLVAFECHSESAVYAVDVSNGQRSDDRARQRRENRLLLRKRWAVGGHIAGVARGLWQDWAAVSLEAGDDPFDGDVSDWSPYKQEIILVNVLTGEVRRLAHHRSRGLGKGCYRCAPRVSVSWDGRHIGWASNFNHPVREYADIYAITLPEARADEGREK
jgi:hypothetical protein